MFRAPRLVPRQPDGTLRSWLAALDPNDARYPRPGWYSVVRWIARLAWIPFSVYLGAVASNLVAFGAHKGVSVFVSATALTQAMMADHLLALAGRSPATAALIIVPLLILAGFGRVVFRDQRREAAVLRVREMQRMVAAWEARSAMAADLSREITALQSEITAAAELLGAQPPLSGAEKVRALRQRIARLTEISAQLSQDVDVKRLMDEAVGQQMAAWERQQRVFGLVLGLTTLAAGWTIPLITIV